MTDINKIIDTKSQDVEAAVEKVTDAARDVVKTVEEQSKEAARQAFEATKASRSADVASVGAADGNTSTVAGS